MAIPNPFRRKTPQSRDCWGYHFEWSPLHMTPQDTEPLKHSYDRLADDCLSILDEIAPPAERSRSLPRGGNLRQIPAPSPKSLPVDKATGKAAPSLDTEKANATPSHPPRDLYALLRDHRAEHPKLQELWDQVNTVPGWVDWQQIGRGQQVFYRYGGACLTGLAYQSLLGGMAAARVVETLARTGGFGVKVARRRLFETTQHILQTTKSIESLQPGGEGFASSVRVRFLHAAVRRRILALAQDKPEYWSVEQYGIPINDLDSIATILTFSATLIWMSLPRQGIFLREQETLDYLACWRYIAHVIGCPTDVFATPQRAKAMMESILLHEVRPSEMSGILANNIIKALDSEPPSYASADMLIASARWLNGNDLCDALSLPRPGFYYSALMAGQCFFFIAFAYAYRVLPAAWDQRKIAYLRKIFYSIIVDSKYGLQGQETLFEFKYVPELSTVTEVSTADEDKPRLRGIEMRNLKALAIGVGVLGFVSWATVELVSGVVGFGWRTLVQ